MNKKDLLHMRKLNATPTMLKIAKEDVPEKTTVYEWGHNYQVVRRKYQLYLRCCITVRRDRQ